MAQIIEFPGQNPTKIGYKRVQARKQANLERHGQLNLFRLPLGQVVDLPRQLTPFEEALLLDGHDDEKATEAYHRAIEAGDCVAEAYCNLGIIESEANKFTEAFDCFTLSLVNDPRHFESHYNLGNLYLDEGDFRLARLHYEICAVLEPSFPDTYFNLGLVLALTREFDLAKDSILRYKALVPEHERVKADELLASLKQSLTAQT